MLEDQIKLLAFTLLGSILMHINGWIRSRGDRRLIEDARRGIADANLTIEQERENARAYREKNEEDAKALQIRITQEALDRNAQLIATLREEREEHKANLAEWREDRNEWKKERAERDKQITTLDKEYSALKSEFEAIQRELQRVRDESSERETVIKEQSKIIEAQAATISRHETTIEQLQTRVKTLEDMNAELERLRIEALLTAPSDDLIAVKREANMTDQELQQKKSEGSSAA